MDTFETGGVVELLRATVAINSVNSAMGGVPDSEARLGEYLAASASSSGFDVRSFPVTGFGANVVVLFERGRPLPWIVFDSHLDTVPVAGMSIDPFGAEIRDGRLWGRGACDTKGSGAAMLAALRRYAKESEGANNVALLYSVDEESGMRGIRAFIRDGIPALGIGIQGMIVGEPTRLRAVVAHNGVSRFRIRTKGVAAHASDPSLGKSAISAMIKIVDSLENRYAPGLRSSHPLTGKSVLSVNTIQGGSAWNVIPDGCEVQVDRRLIPGQRPALARSELASELERIRGEHPEVDFELDCTHESPPLAPDDSAALLPAVARALRSADLPSEGGGVPYATHAGELAAAGLPAIVLGPGDAAKAHTKDEYIDLAELGRSVEVYLAIMRGASG